MSKCWSCLLLVASWIYFKTHSVSDACSFGKYGLNCSYTCHCTADNCYGTGCSDNCEEGWSGSKCTKENVAVNKTAYQSALFKDGSANGPLTAVDGNNNQNNNYCLLTDTGHEYTWWEVDLGRDYYIHHTVIYFRTPYELRKNGVQLYSSKQPRQNNTGHGCGSISTSSPNIATLICNDTARYITLYRSTGDSAMDFCEVQVFVCDACSFGYDCSKFCHCRDAPCNYVTGECTGGCKPDWTGRTCSVCVSDHYGPLCENSCSSRHCDESRSNSSCNKMTGRCDDECIPGWMDQDCTKKCSESKYGQDCANFCSQRKCLGNSSCNHVNGKCDHGCDRGYQSEDCTKVCPSDKYGFNCIMSCEKRNCYGNSVCDSLNGTCVNGCLKGWDLPDCVTECHNNTFGPSCMFKCSERLCKGDNSTCDIEDGVCQYGCQTGWKNANCTEKCDSGSYGPDCAFDCNKRHCKTKSASCNHVNGSCGGECENNYKGIDCAGCDGKYGPECSSACTSRHCKADDAPCDYVTGLCDGPCNAGWQGDTCTDKCDTGKYGDKCAMFCAIRNCINKDVCPREDGECLGGCNFGYEGLDCLRAQAVTSNSDSTTIAVSVVACVLFVVLVIVTSLFIWHLKSHRVKSDSYQQEMRKTNSNPPSQPTDPSVVEYEIVDRQDGGRNSSRAFSSQQVDTSRSANYVNSSTSRDQIDAQPRHYLSGGGYVNAGQTNEYEKLDLSNAPQNDYDRITGV
ncbi:multiple epidermal growth factor-like domains protein 11 [Gigantopelta aegis]|uniref:multiple epidermal growth factor-like domains protein 11 n=1 Tax=Gigantopelta aegis TaxID=1735272 RepID=UPI001B8894EB|nr:multiple epidermal growth factor-like domains protein 11 [Gigantopelta aegis]